METDVSRERVKFPFTCHNLFLKLFSSISHLGKRGGNPPRFKISKDSKGFFNYSTILIGACFKRISLIPSFLNFTFIKASP